MPLTQRGAFLKGAVWYDSDTSAPTAEDFPGASDKGSLLVDAANKKLWVNTGTPAVPVWETPGNLGSAAQVKAPFGTFSLPGYTFEGDEDSGVYRISANVIGMVAGTQLALSVTNGQINLLKPVVFPNSGSPEFSFTGDTQTEFRFDHTVVFSFDHDNDALGACTFEFWGGMNGRRFTIHDDPHVIQVGDDSDTPVEEQIKSGDGETNATGCPFRFKPGESRGTNKEGATLYVCGGQATGSGTPGGISFQTSLTGASGEAVRSLIERLALTENALTFATGVNLVFSTGTGTKIGSAADQKIGKWGVAPVVQPSGWTAATGTPTRTTFATGSVTLPQLAERVKALIDDLLGTGEIGA